VLALVVIVPGLGSHGFWEPQEIAVVDQAQELAAARGAEAEGEGAIAVELEEAEDDEAGEAAAAKRAPAEAAPAELYARAIATSIATLGPGERAARLPMALFGLVALAATAALGWRLAGARAGALAAAALLSFPLFVFPSRLVVGDLAAVAAHALIVLGAAGLCWPGASRRGARRLVVALDLALVGVGVALGHAAVGALLGVAVPLLAVSLAGWLAVLGEWRRAREIRARLDAPLVGTLAVSALAALAALWILVDAFEFAAAYPGDRAIFGLTLEPASGHLATIGGAWRASPDAKITFDTLFETFAFGLYPWSALAPIALVMPALAYGAGRRAWAAYLLLAWVVMAWAAAVALHRAVGPAHLPALAAVAVAVGVFLDDLLRARAGEGLGQGGPGQEARGGEGQGLPLVAVFVALAAVVLAKDILAFPERLAGVHLVGDEIDVPAVLRRHVGMVAALGLLAALALAVGLHGWTPRPNSRLAPLRTPMRLALPGAVGASIIYALVLSHGWIPAVSGQFSSKGLFDALSTQRAPGDKLVILGAPGPGHELYARGELETVSSRDELVELFRGKERAFALIRRSRLCPVQQTASSENVGYHVIYDGNAEFLLLSNYLDEGQPDLNPLSRMILREPPASIATPFDATFDERIRLIGYDMPARVSRGETFEMTLYYEVLAPVSRNWKVFVHIDRGRDRFNGDHEPAEGVCGTRYWQKGDIVVDRFEVSAGGTGHPRGEHQVWTGFFVGSRGSWTNMEVSEADDADPQHRVRLGTIRVE
jgi:hypothetical protein